MADIDHRQKIYLQKAVSGVSSNFLLFFFSLKVFLRFYNEFLQKNQNTFT